MIRYSIKLPSVLKFIVTSDLPLRSCFKNKMSVVTVANSDILDCFVDNLTSNKENKWKTRKKTVNRVTCQNKEVDVSSLIDRTIDITEDSVDDCIQNNSSSPDLLSILNVCLNKRIFPSQYVMAKLAHTFARCGNTGGIDLLMSISELRDGSRLQEEYRIFQAEAIWRSGESAEKSMQILSDVYRDQPALRRHVRSSLRPLFAEVILSRGEASLMQAKNLVLKLASLPYEDHIPLSYLWSRCILSECFADQQLAVELEEASNEKALLKKAVGSRMDAVLGEAFVKHQIDAVYRILEALLRLSMTKHSQDALGKLFDYKYLVGDMAGCDAVLKACDALQLDVGFTRRKQLEKIKAKRSNSRRVLSGCGYQTKTKSDYSHKPAPKFIFKI